MTSNTMPTEGTSQPVEPTVETRGGLLDDERLRERLRDAEQQFKHAEEVARRWAQEHPLASVAAAAAAGYIVARLLK